LRKFERAMTRFTSDKDSRPGIKLVKHNKKYVAEVKIGGEDDRLMSKDGIVFDEFELSGLHKKKKGKRA